MTARTTASVNARLARHSGRVEEVQERLHAWFGKHGRSFPWRAESASNYVRVVSEVLLQRTRAEAVAEFFPRFIKRYSSWKRLAAATDGELRSFLEPIGLWRRRAASLRALANEMRTRGGRFPRERTEIELLPGIGQYIAGAVLIFCHDEAAPLLDVNMARVLERCFGPRKLVDIRYDPWLQALSRRVVRHANARAINWAILDLAASTCTIRNPHCAACPLNSCCRHARHPRVVSLCSGGNGTTAVTISARRSARRQPC